MPAVTAPLVASGYTGASLNDAITALENLADVDTAEYRIFPAVHLVMFTVISVSGYTDPQRDFVNNVVMPVLLENGYVVTGFYAEVD